MYNNEVPFGAPCSCVQPKSIKGSSATRAKLSIMTCIGFLVRCFNVDVGESIYLCNAKRCVFDMLRVHYVLRLSIASCGCSSMDADSPHAASCPIDAAVCPQTTVCGILSQLCPLLTARWCTLAQWSKSESGFKYDAIKAARILCQASRGLPAINIAIPNICNLLHFIPRHLWQ